MSALLPYIFSISLIYYFNHAKSVNIRLELDVIGFRTNQSHIFYYFYIYYVLLLLYIMIYIIYFCFIFYIFIFYLMY